MSFKMRFDFTNLLSRASTWLALLSLSATGGLGAYAVMPERVQLLMPDWTLMSLGATAMLSALLIPVATSFKQRGLGRANQVEISSTVKVEGDVSSADATRIAEAVHGSDGSHAKATEDPNAPPA